MAKGQDAEGAGSMGAHTHRPGPRELGIEAADELRVDGRGNQGDVCGCEEADEDAWCACDSSGEYRLWPETDDMR